MSNVYPEINPTSAGIYMTNAFDISEEDLGIYQNACTMLYYIILTPLSNS